jgi:hypothetical protein
MMTKFFVTFALLVLCGCNSTSTELVNQQLLKIENNADFNNEKELLSIDIFFKEENGQLFNKYEKEQITRVLIGSEHKIRRLLPSLPEKVTVNLAKTTKNYNNLGGVNGQASAPGVVDMEVSTTYPQGTDAAIANLTPMVFHEFHHLVRGWTMKGNKFDSGMDIAAINEGMAVAFSVKYSGAESNWANYPENVSDWVIEILNLPKYASYGKWVVNHPDGRQKIAYKAGRYIIDEAVKHSGKSILELTDLAPIEVIHISGVMDAHVNSHFKLAEFYHSNNTLQLAIKAYEKAATLSLSKGNADDEKKFLTRINLINHPISLLEKESQQLVGNYHLEKLNFTIISENNRLYVKHKGWPMLELIHQSKNKFYLWGEPETFEFIVDTNHKVEKLIFNNGKKSVDLLKAF